MKNIFWLLLPLLILSACNGVDKEKVKAQTDLAKTYLARESIDTAMTIIDEVLAIAPKHIEALLVKGKALAMSGQYEAAITMFDNMIQQAPDAPTPYLERSIAHLNHGNIELADADVDKGLKMMPGSSPMVLQKGLIHQRRGEQDRAIEIFSQLIEKDPKNARLVFLRALSKKWSKDLDGALEDINQCMKMEMYNPFEAYEQRAFILREKGMDIEALDDFAIMISLAKKAEANNMICAARNSRAELLLDNSMWDLAKRDLDRSIPLDSSNPYGLVLRARYHIAMKEKEDACADLNLAIERDYTKLYGPAALNLQNLHCQN